MKPTLSRKDFLLSLGALLLAGSACSDGDDGDSSSAGAGGEGEAGSDADPKQLDSGVDRDSSTKDAEAPVGDASGGSEPDSGSDAGGPGADACDGDLLATSSGESHTHRVTIPVADILAGGTKQYETSEDFAHTHWIELDDADFAILRSGGTVTKTTCSGGDHLYVLGCGQDAATTELPVGCDDECGNAADNLCT